MTQTIAITGSSGFIGSKLVNSLEHDNFNILKLDIKNGFDLINNSCLKKIPKFDTIVHLASKTFVPDSFTNPSEFYYTNFVSTLNVLELAKKFNAKVIFFSSYVYGTPQCLPIKESHPLQSHNPYSQSKIICEKLCEGYASDFNMPITIFRPFNIYGTGQNSNFLIPSIISQVKTGIVNLQDSKPKRDFIFVDDIISAIQLAISSARPCFDIFNLGSGVSHAISDIISIIREVYSHEFEVKFTDETRKNEVMDVIADVKHAKDILLWEPKVNLRDGIIKILNES